MKIEWKDAYMLHIKEIDCQHKQLIDMSGRLLKMAMNMSSTEISDEVQKLMNDLNDYTEYHFNFEEKLMDQYCFSGVEEHKEIHVGFINRLKIFENQIQTNMDRDLLIKMLEFLTGWIAAHFMVEDKKYSLEFQERRIDELFK